MDDKRNSIDVLSEKLNILLRRQEIFQRDIKLLRHEIENLKSQGEVEISKISNDDNSTIVRDVKEKEINIPESVHKKPEPFKKESIVKSANVEKFIGENLINKIGIIVTIIGIAIGAKYAIDHQLINPLTRIILGYFAGIVLMGFSIYLKKKYENYSAVLLSGSMSIMYFITYAAYEFYELLPQTVAFILMVIFTVFTVYASISYNKQVIAHIGLVAAYAVPFLLSDGSGRILILFSYISIINIGILFIAFKKTWKALFYSAFILTWLIYLAWFTTKYNYNSHFILALVFLLINFVTFYLTTLYNNIIFKEKYQYKEIAFLLINAFIFYIVGYLIIDEGAISSEFLGLFTVINAFIHFGAAHFIKPRLLLDKKIFYLVSGLVIVFLSLAVPVQLDGNWVTLLWFFLAVTLFWIGRIKQIKLYESFGYVLVYIGFLSLIHDWLSAYSGYFSNFEGNSATPFININFFSSVMVILAYSLINIVDKNKNYISTLSAKTNFYKILKYSLPALLILTIFLSIRLEIANIFNWQYVQSLISQEGENSFYLHIYDSDINNFKEVWLAIYNLFFVVILTIANLNWIKSELLGKVNFFITAFAVLAFMITGLAAINRLHESYMLQLLSEHYTRDVWNIYIRYFSYLFWAAAMYSGYRFVKYEATNIDFKIAFDFILYLSLLGILSNEFILLVKQTDAAKAFRLGLSILWGLYSLFLIIVGIWKKKKYLRIGAISLFGITLVKLFLYDTSNLDTIPKTIIFVSLGVLLLIISFLYNKYKWTIFNENDS